MKKSLEVVFACIALLALHAGAQTTSMQPPVKTAPNAPFRAVPELPYRVVTNFFKFPKAMVPGEASAVAVNSKGHIFPVSYTHLHKMASVVGRPKIVVSVDAQTMRMREDPVADTLNKIALLVIFCEHRLGSLEKKYVALRICLLYTSRCV